MWFSNIKIINFMSILWFLNKPTVSINTVYSYFVAFGNDSDDSYMKGLLFSKRRYHR